MVKVGGRNSNGKTVKQTVKNGRKISVDDAARPVWVTVARRQQFAAASRFWSIPNLMPRSTVTRVWLTTESWMSSPGSALFVVDQHWHLTIFFSWRFVSVVWQDSDRVQSVTPGTWYSGRSSMLSSDSWLIDRRTKPPKPDASQVVVPARIPKPVIGSGGLSSSRFDDDVPEVNCTWTASFSWRVKEAALWFESHGSKNLTGGTTWSSQPTSTDWLTGTHHWSSPRSKLPYKYQKITKISCDIGSRFEASWLDCVTMMSEMTIAVIVVSASCHHLTRADSGWSRISWFSRVTLPWLRGGTSVAPWRHKCSHVPVLPPSVWPSSRSNFDLGPSPSDSTEKNSIISELMVLECSFPLRGREEIIASQRLLPDFYTKQALKSPLHTVFNWNAKGETRKKPKNTASFVASFRGGVQPRTTVQLFMPVSDVDKRPSSQFLSRL